jgi:hypothetical protein
MESNKRVTAVEWLVEQIIKYDLVPKGTNPDNVLFHKAKAMEKEQIIDAHNIGRNDKHNDFDREGEQYYKETFNNTQS